MQIYHFDSETGEFTGQTVANKDPKRGRPIVPAYSTLVPPPETTAGEAAVWNDDNGVWSVVEDHRGKTVYAGWESAGVVDYIGPIRDGHSLSQGDKPQSVINAERAGDIKTELQALDRWLPRAVEDLIETEVGLGMQSDYTAGVLTTYDKLSPENQARLVKKQALRVELAVLEGGE